MKPKTIVQLIVLAVFVLILFQNRHSTPVELLFWEIHMPRFILILSVLFTGLVLGWFTHLAYSKGKHKREAAAPQKIDDIEQGNDSDAVTGQGGPAA